MRSRVEFISTAGMRVQIAADAIVSIAEVMVLSAVRLVVVRISYRVGPRDPLMCHDVIGEFAEVVSEVEVVTPMLRLTRTAGDGRHEALAVPPHLLVGVCEASRGCKVVCSNGTTAALYDVVEPYEVVVAMLDAAESSDVAALEATVPPEDDVYGTVAPHTIVDDWRGSPGV